jgi:hypothetical protein
MAALGKSKTACVASLLWLRGRAARALPARPRSLSYRVNKVLQKYHVSTPRRPT